MKKVRSWYFPDEEQHLMMFIERTDSYQEDSRIYSLAQVKKYKGGYNTAIDIGAHVGLWSKDLAGVFKKVYAFEPMPKMIECYEKNVLEQYKNVTLYKCALGHKEGFVHMDFTDNNTGNTHVNMNITGGETEMKTLDSFQFTGIDYIKIDAESFEEYVLRGATQTILINKPVITIEQKPHPFYNDQPDFHGQFGGRDYLLSLGMKYVGATRNDLVFAFN